MPNVESYTPFTDAPPTYSSLSSGSEYTMPFSIRFILSAVVALNSSCMMFAKPPADLDYGRTRASEGGRYRATIKAPDGAIPRGKLHAWTLHLETASGTAIDTAAITVDGGMPQHGHGLPTKPLITKHLGNGDYVVEGMKFNMGGWWVVKFRIGAAEADSIIFNLNLSNQTATADARWTKDERAMLQSLSLAALESLPVDPSNQYADRPEAARLGARLFFDTRLSGNGRVSCATCHQPDRDFQDGVPFGKGVGVAGRRTMPIAGTAYSPWQFWDGRADSQWAQALGPLESPVEHGGTRDQYARIMREAYNAEYRAVFGIAATKEGDVSRVYANIGKAIAAYERKITFTPSRFDRYVTAELSDGAPTHGASLSADERAGLRLFIGKANCVNCHNGPLFTDNHFHNTGVPQSSSGQASDSGRTTGVRTVTKSDFNCLSRFSDAKPDECTELRFAVTEGQELVRAFKTPSLRNVVARGPYMHAGQFASLAEVLGHYNRAPKAPSGTSELRTLRLSGTELRQLEAFLNTLVSPLSFPLPTDSEKRLGAAAVPTTR
jgi:cytochrome c peroxidase